MEILTCVGKIGPMPNWPDCRSEKHNERKNMKKNKSLFFIKTFLNCGTLTSTRLPLLRLCLIFLFVFFRLEKVCYSRLIELTAVDYGFYFRGIESLVFKQR